MLEVIEVVVIEAFVAKLAIETLNVSVLRWLASSNQPYPKAKTTNWNDPAPQGGWTSAR